MKYLNSVLLVLLLSAAATAAENPRVAFHTNYGAFTVELYPEQAPATVRNFLRYVKDGFYEGVIFHRVIPDFIIQGGGYTAAYHKKTPRDPIANEADNGLKNLHGTLAMARLQDPDSATSQFFINMNDNARLDRRDDSPRGAGYTVFGKVTKGIETLESIQEIDTGADGPFRKHLPIKPVIIQRAVPVGKAVLADEEADTGAADEAEDQDAGDDVSDDEDYADEADAADDEDYADEADAGEDEDYTDDADAADDDDYTDDADSGDEEDDGAADDETEAAPKVAAPRPAKSAKKAASVNPNALHEPEPPDVPAVQ